MASEKDLRAIAAIMKYPEFAGFEESSLLKITCYVIGKEEIL